MAGDSKAKIQREAEKFVIQGKIAAAISEYQKIIKVDPDDILTLNTIGDLYLRLHKPEDAGGYFTKVADHYAHNNFILKAIAVYRKILSCDPQSAQVHKTLASLYAKQGLNVEARNEYMRVAEICLREGKSAEAQLAYEKVADLDPANIAVQLKLADIHLREGSQEKAHFYFLAAGRAQAKASDIPSALDSFEKALEIQPGEIRALTGHLEAASRGGQLPRALQALKQSMAAGFEGADVLELLVKAHLAGGDTSSAGATLQRVVAKDQSQYPRFFEIQKRLLDSRDYDAAATCLDPITEILIEKRATKAAIEAYLTILNAIPGHLGALTRIAELYSAANDQPHNLEILDRLADRYMELSQCRDALRPLEKILQITPDSTKHLEMHRKCFENVFPGLPYTPPVKTDREPTIETPSKEREFESAESGGPGANTTLVEVDLLLNYGMKEKALEMLRALETQDPSDVDVRLRLLAMYKDDNQASLAAEECLYLALAHRKLGDEDSVQKFIDEAGRLDPAVVASRPELISLAYRTGAGQSPASPGPAALSPDAGTGLEVDLSEDLSEIFFKDGGPAAAGKEPVDAAVETDDMVEQFVPSTVPPRSTTSLSEQLQEVDFYIRLGFYDEARLKLSELEKEHPDHPELLIRQRQIAPEAPEPDAVPIALGGASDSIEIVPEEVPAEPPGPEDFRLIEEPAKIPDQPPTPAADETLAPQDLPALSLEEEPRFGDLLPVEEAPHSANQTEEPEARGMFADLLDQVNSMTDQEIAHEEYETHFSLGIAYREMSLVDEAIKEFQDAMKVLSPGKHPSEVIQCCGMLSTCFLEKGMPRSAIRWCETGISVQGISQHESMALRYDMAIGLMALGEFDKALENFTILSETDPSYRDVNQKICELRGDSGRHAT
jgi:tetratricopeptide (TPR) repeat protein